ncbi:MAG: family 10 glycosylhydrolase [Candidatus Marinimicrobia bacterium]|nr:family 10 glycosylhydrolase [Candidatus Neomarinimicrobiota bacterium]
MPPLSIRGLWIVRESMVSRDEVDRALSFASESGFNHVFVQIRGRGDAYYNSLIVPRSDRIRERDFDPLAYAVSRGHQLGLNVHAWVTTYLIWSARRPPADRTHVYHLHPEWQEVDAAGRAQRNIDLAAPRDGAFEGIYLAPTHPEVNHYLQAVFTELILNYNIDGLHLDYSRYFDFDYGYNEEGIGVFRRRYNFDPRQLDKGRSRATSGDIILSEQAELWNDYRRQKITSLVTALHAIITISGKEVLLTSAVKPDAREARNKYYQDWAAWLRDGILDYALPMNYAVGLDEYRQHLDGIAAELPEHYRNGVIMGVAVYNQSPAAAARKVRQARQRGYGAICVFSYDAYKTDLSRFDPLVRVLRQ